MVAGIVDIDWVSTIFEVTIVMPLVVAGTFFLYKKVSTPNEQVRTQVLGNNRLHILVKKQLFFPFPMLQLREDLEP